MPAAHRLTAPARPRAGVEERLRRVLALHFDPRLGSPYWLERQEELGLDVLRDIRSPDALDLLGPMDPTVLRERSVWDFVPLGIQRDPSELVVVESGGTLGAPQRAVFRGDEFHAAFVAPFLAAMEGMDPLPPGARWAWIGPGGPHAIGKAAREVCRAMGSPDPFAVDFDPRWFKHQAEGSLARRRYLRHVLDQALALFAREPIEVLFTTPPVAAALGEEMPAAVRRRIALLHLGGLPVDAPSAAALRRCFPAAAVLSGYGNSLLGMCPEVEPGAPGGPIYRPHGDRLILRLVRGEAPLADGAAGAPARSFRQVDHGERGRVLATRLDESFLLVNLLERDTAVRLPPRSGLAERGFFHDGLGDPRPAAEVPASRLGIY